MSEGTSNVVDIPVHGSARERAVRLALLGAPNCGKTSLFNALTGGKAKVANYPGVTVEYRKGGFTLPTGQDVELMDLPGVYGDCGHSMDERVTIDALRGNLDGERRPDGILYLLDATSLGTHLHNVLQAKSYGLPIVVVLNMMDLAARDGITIDRTELERQLGVPVVEAVAVRASGRAALMEVLSTWTAKLVHGGASIPVRVNASLKDMQTMARAIAESTVVRPDVRTRTERIDRWTLHPVVGPLILIAIMFVMFQSVYAWAGPAMDAIDWTFGRLQAAADAVIPDGLLQSLVSDGIIAGVGAVVIFLPQIIILFAFILALEASGYMARAAFLVDTLMAKVGLNGRAFIPLLSSFACAIPGIMAARVIEGERDRLTTVLIAPLMTCSARLPVYILLIGAFIPATKVGPFGLQGLVMFGLYLAGVVSALLVAFAFKKTLLKGAKPSLLMELPSYKVPVFRDYLMGLWERARIFIVRAGRIILPVTVLIWFLATFPTRENGLDGTFAGMIGRVLQPVLAPIGFNLEMAISLIPGLAAREVVVGALATIYAIEDDNEVALQTLIAAQWTLPMALSLLAWYVFAPQCLSTLAVMKKETNGWKWPIIAFVYLTTLAYVAAFLTYRIALGAGL